LKALRIAMLVEPTVDLDAGGVLTTVFVAPAVYVIDTQKLNVIHITAKALTVRNLSHAIVLESLQLQITAAISG
jgi:hypothetical protein